MPGLLEICYICKTSLPRQTSFVSSTNTKDPLRHSHYPWMCLTCGDFNFWKRSSTADLTGKVAIVTGGRIKIGYEIVLKLLRAKCKTVIVTTRFPTDAYRRFEAEPDFSVWSSNLRLYKLDLRFLGAVNQFCETVLKNFGQLDILIQNAAQTIRRPAAYYKQLANSESELPLSNQLMLLNNDKLDSPLVEYIQNGQEDVASTTLDVFRGTKHFEDEEIKQQSSTPSLCTKSSSSPPHSSQLLIHPEDFKFASNSKLCKSTFPVGRKDEDGNQLDLRKRNTWITDLEEVEPVEMVEVSLVNYMAPFIILQKMTTLMKRPRGVEENTDFGYIVLVSAMEGKFERCFKTGKHPHTNAAKAALNMLVRTSARHYYNDLGIVFNAVDTGWVTDEHPVGHSSRLSVPPPLDIIDGAARVLDPIFHSINHPNTFPIYGRFLKDYMPRAW